MKYLLARCNRSLLTPPANWGIRLKIIGDRIRMFLDLQDPNPLVRGVDPALDPNPSLFS
jgi:hypothetical protein